MLAMTCRSEVPLVLPKAARFTKDGAAVAVLANVAITLISQCIALLQVLDDEKLSQESKISPSSTIGKHLR